ncbi:MULTISPECIES: mycobacterial-type methylenetetrahydrofolate reductase [Pseudonocardia]|uniref:Methylenetetrahydrofolate reductase n=2 Tax=Pseudonocardia TaxID=1847 RepID=A0A1Y2MJ12_PSEAH|nr:MULTISPECIES: mycobacterial-type methylenetetrahydrofolate reductase [Pseudonocardia]OSY34438.1 hypothetical protein BG845_06863 [Pseudonocardia autotrophica]TDN72012.1 hypothetical protein C8E95_1050 [Pseudonocardia autotrophica]BBG02701.1 hypothetical protein Pdca_39100 [Pseudonocardia autotrophica]GEC29724.1 hypothetical protein PSA01_67530 [Pseudonocardia saturnea]
MALQTIAFELVAPNVELGRQPAVEEAGKVLEYSAACGMQERIGHILIPGMIEEDDDRPVAMKPKMDALDFWSTISPELPNVRGLCTQVTSFMAEPQLTQRLSALRGAGMDGIVFVGVPRTMNDGDGSGTAPVDALATYPDLVPERGVVVIPTRDGEVGRLNFKCDRGATFGLTQLLYSDWIVTFLRDFAAQSPHRPELLLSFGFVPRAENRVNLINWLIQDPRNPLVSAEQDFVTKLAGGEPAEKRAMLLELYKRVIDGVLELGFPVSLHFEAPYGASAPAFETFAAMLDHWAPDAV